MSRDRWEHPDPAVGVPLVAKDNLRSFMGDVRLPSVADEIGAVKVIDLRFGGRILLFPHSATHYRVQRVG